MQLLPNELFLFDYFINKYSKKTPSDNEADILCKIIGNLRQILFKIGVAETTEKQIKHIAQFNFQILKRLMRE